MPACDSDTRRVSESQAGGHVLSSPYVGVLRAVMGTAGWATGEFRVYGYIDAAAGLLSLECDIVRESTVMQLGLCL